MIRASAILGVHKLDLVVHSAMRISNLPDRVVGRPAVRHYCRAWQHVRPQYRDENCHISSINRRQEAFPLRCPHLYSPEDPLVPHQSADVVLLLDKHTLVDLNGDSGSTDDDWMGHEVFCTHVAAEVFPVHNSVVCYVQLVV